MLANFLYLFALTTLSPWILYRRVRHRRYRRGWRQKLFGLSADEAATLRGGFHQRPCLWIHAVSVGEVGLIGGVIQRLEKRYPQTPIVVSCSTDTGYDLAVQRFGSDRVFFCPLDFTWAVGRTLRHLKPRALLLAELELWPNLIKAARHLDAHVIVINGRLSDRSASGYRRFHRLTESLFASLSRVECQDQTSAENFAACGTPAERIAVGGSLKFDNAPRTRDCADVQSRSLWAGVEPHHVVWIFGSTQEGEERIALDVYQKLWRQHPELRLILVPRHPERFERAANLVTSDGLIAHRRSCDEAMRPSQWTSDRVVVVDTIGELRHWWGVGQIATVGGSFGDRGGQNMLEPAGYGCAISFGPNTRNFADISRRLIDAGGAVRVVNPEELLGFVEHCLADRCYAKSVGLAAKGVVEHHRGATRRTIAAISILLDSPAGRQRLVA
jgi:3-deoxy-D-manno-octulosonic-acid transferase